MKISTLCTDTIRRMLGIPHVSFLFMDDAISDAKWKPQISALTGLVVPVDQYVDLRGKFYAILQPFIQPKAQTVARPPEMHGHKLPGLTPAHQLENASAIVDLVVANELQFFRVGYYITEELQKVFATDKWMVGVCWSSLLHTLEERLRNQMLIPVMDGIDPAIVRLFSPTVQWCNVGHSAGIGDAISIEHAQRLLGEVFYADSEYSVFTQVADVVSYLRKVTDMENDGRDLPEGKQHLLPLARRLDAAAASESIIAWTHNGIVHGPQKRARRPADKGPLVCSQTVHVKSEIHSTKSTEYD